MSRTVITRQTRLFADTLARERMGYGPDDYIRPEHKREYRSEVAAALRQLTRGQTYYTAACFPTM